MSYTKPEITYGTVESMYACKGGACNGPDRPSLTELCLEDENSKEPKVA